MNEIYVAAFVVTPPFAARAVHLEAYTNFRSVMYFLLRTSTGADVIAKSVANEVGKSGE